MIGAFVWSGEISELRCRISRHRRPTEKLG